METISVSKLKSQLSAELKRVQNGLVLTVVDHKHPIAILEPIHQESFFVHEAEQQYTYSEFTPLIKIDPMVLLEEERKDSW